MEAYIIDKFNNWLKNVKDKDLALELENIKNNPKEIEERFYQSLNFGTAGLRGILGAGTNRMNIYTVMQSTQGYANYLNSLGRGGTVAIAYDNRKNSALFARASACVLAKNNISVKIFKTLMPTPVLSYAVRELRADGGIVITASHNSKEYNGYKVYNNEGCQISEEIADLIFKEISRVDIFSDISSGDFDELLSQGKISYIDDRLCDSFVSRCLDFVTDFSAFECNDLRVAYTPLNGTGLAPVTALLKKLGIRNLFVVEEQKNPDECFTTCPIPNPETVEALSLGLSLARDKNADLLLATDPDADRVGVAVRDKDSFKILNGNEVGVLLLYYIANAKIALSKMPKSPVMVKSVVSEPLADEIARHYGIKPVNVLTGFKNIGDYMKSLEPDNLDSFILGFEESCGYLATTLARDKDSISTCGLICEMACHYKKQNKTLWDVLQEIYKDYGYYMSKNISFTFEGKAGKEKINRLMESFRGEFSLPNLNYNSVFDFKKNDKLNANMIKIFLEHDCSFIIRPSGTEPKIKFYIYVKGNSQEDKLQKFNAIKSSITEYINNFE